MTLALLVFNGEFVTSFTSLSLALGEGFGFGAGLGGGVLLGVAAGDVLVVDVFLVGFSGVTSTFGGLKKNLKLTSK